MNTASLVEKSVNEAGTCGKIDTPLTQPVRSSFFELRTNQGPILVDTAKQPIGCPYRPRQCMQRIDDAETNIKAQMDRPLAARESHTGNRPLRIS